MEKLIYVGIRLIRDLREQTRDMKSDLKSLLDGRIRNYKSIDYVCGWFIKAVDYGLATPTKSAFVTTNSICQGSHVSAIWPYILNKKYQIPFAHTSFKWKNLAAKNAGVTVAIVGLANTKDINCRIFSINDDTSVSEKKCNYISPYLVPDVET